MSGKGKAKTLQRPLRIEGSVAAERETLSFEATLGSTGRTRAALLARACLSLRYASSAPGPGATVLAELPNEALPALARRLGQTVGHAGDFGSFYDLASVWPVFGVQCWRLGKRAALSWLLLRWDWLPTGPGSPKGQEGRHARGGSREGWAYAGLPGLWIVCRSARKPDLLDRSTLLLSDRRSATRVRKSAPAGLVVLRPDRWRFRRREEPSPDGTIRSRSGFVQPEWAIAIR